MNKSASAVFVLGCMILWACATAGSGPQAWIDYPLNNADVPLAPLSITAHATHPDGVASIEFIVDGEQIAAIDVSSRLLEDATFEWTPLGVGKYTIEVRGLDTAGNPGMHAVAIVYVGGLPLPTTETPTVSETVTVTLSPTPGTVTPTRTFTPTSTEYIPTDTPETPQPPSKPTVTANQNANCRSGPSSEFNVEGYLMQGQQAVIEGRLANNSWFVITPPGESSSCWIAVSVVDVSGELSGVKIVAAPPPPEPPADTTPPTISANSVNPAEIVTQTCDDSGAGARYSTSTIGATDESGIFEVAAGWTLKDFHSGAALESGTVTYTYVGGQNYQTTIGYVAYTGTIYVEGFVVDNNGNKTKFNQTIQVNCSW